MSTEEEHHESDEILEWLRAQLKVCFGKDPELAHLEYLIPSLITLVRIRESEVDEEAT